MSVPNRQPNPSSIFSPYLRLLGAAHHIEDYLCCSSPYLYHRQLSKHDLRRIDKLCYLYHSFFCIILSVVFDDQKINNNNNNSNNKI